MRWDLPCWSKLARREGWPGGSRGLVLWCGVAVILRFEAKVIQELCCRWSVRLEVPSFVKGGMVASFDRTGVKIDVAYVVVRCSVADEDPGEVMSIKFAAAIASSFDTDTGPKNL